MSNAAHGWKIEIPHEPEKILKRLPKDLVRRILSKIEELKTNPYPSGCKKISGYEDVYRIRVGDWRIVYVVEGDRLVILILEIAPRGGAYRNL